MSFRIGKILILCSLLFAGPMIWAQKGASALLCRMIEQTGNVDKYHQIPLVKEMSDSVCVHYGVSLFSKELKESVRTDYPVEYLVYQFLERYALEMLLEPDETSLMYKLKDDKVLLLEGNLNSLFRVVDKDCDFDYQPNDTYCEVAWKSGGRDILRIAFPMHYALLTGLNKIEQEQRFMNEVLRTNLPEMTEKMPMLPVLPECEESNKSSHLNELLQGSLCDVTLQVMQSLYASKGTKTQEFDLPLKQWLTYCQYEGMRLSIGIEKEDEYYLEVLMMAENPYLKYNHMMSLMIPKGFMQMPELRVPAKVNAYIPTHNLKNLYGERNEKVNKKSKHIHL